MIRTVKPARSDELATDGWVFVRFMADVLSVVVVPRVLMYLVYGMYGLYGSFCYSLSPVGR